MDEQTIVDALGSGRAELIAGAALLAVVSLLRLYLEPRLEGLRAGDWLSAVAGVAGACAVALLAGAVWWHAVLLSLLAAGPSAGLWRLLASLVPRGRE